MWCDIVCSSLRCLTYLLMVTAAVISTVGGITLVGYNIPSHAKHGDSTLLSCYYKLQPHESLYSVRWYKDNQEFYKFIAAPKQLSRAYPVTGARVQLKASNSTSVSLENVGFDTSGKYGCEISADAPTFDTTIATGHLLIVAPPERPLKITGADGAYHINDQLQVNCSAAKSRPTVLLNWLINGHQAPYTSLVHYRTPADKHGWAGRVLGLQLQLSRQLFVAGRLTISCHAQLATIFSDSASVTLRQPPLPARHKPLEVKDSNGGCINTGLHHLVYFIWLVAIYEAFN